MAKKRASEESLSPAKRQRNLFSPDGVAELCKARDEWLTWGNMPQAEAEALLGKCGTTKAQVQNWFANANRRAKRCAAEGLLLLSEEESGSSCSSECFPPPSKHLEDFQLAMLLGTMFTRKQVRK